MGPWGCPLLPPAAETTAQRRSEGGQGRSVTRSGGWEMGRRSSWGHTGPPLWPPAGRPRAGRRGQAVRPLAGLAPRLIGTVGLSQGPNGQLGCQGGAPCRASRPQHSRGRSPCGHWAKGGPDVPSPWPKCVPGGRSKASTTTRSQRKGSVTYCPKRRAGGQITAPQQGHARPVQILKETPEQWGPEPPGSLCSSWPCRAWRGGQGTALRAHMLDRT